MVDYGLISEELKGSLNLYKLVFLHYFYHSGVSCTLEKIFAEKEGLLPRLTAASVASNLCLSSEACHEA